MENVKDIKSVADHLGVSVQTIYNRISKIDKEKYTVKIKNKTYLKQEGVDLITSPDDINTEEEKDLLLDSQIIPIKQEINDSLIDSLNDQINYLKDLIEKKDEQIASLTTSLQFEQANSKNTFLLIQEKVQKIEEDRQKRWWEFFKK